MLDQDLIDQLKSVFAEKKLEGTIEFKLNKSNHAKYNELHTMLQQMTETSSQIKLTVLDDMMDVPHFKVDYNGRFNGISMTGIPGGHEFTSFVLAILNSDKKGNLPDDGIINRIRKINGPINLKTYISLSCENCPEVVQALNVMAIFRDDFSHEMVDGEFAMDEIQKLGIQGVPSVVSGKKMLHSGKASLMELIEKLEEEFGVNQSLNTKTDLGYFDVAVIGGGPAGSAAAIYTARKGIKTIMVAERIGGQVKDTKGIENLISVPYTEGPELAANLAKHMSHYEIKSLEHRRVVSIDNKEIKTIELNSGEYFTTKAIIIATGANWRKLGIPGEKEHIGRGVGFCPHCDGPFYKGKNVAVVGGGNSGVEAAIDLAGIVNSVVLLAYNELKADEVLIRKVKSISNISIVTHARTAKIIGDGEKISSLEYEERDTKTMKTLQLDGVFVQIGLQANSAFVQDLVETNLKGEIIVDNKCKTNVKGIYAAGDVTNVPYKQIVVSIGEGAKAGLTAFEELAYV